MNGNSILKRRLGGKTHLLVDQHGVAMSVETVATLAVGILILAALLKITLPGGGVLDPLRINLWKLVRGEPINGSVDFDDGSLASNRGDWANPDAGSDGTGTGEKPAGSNSNDSTETASDVPNQDPAENGDLAGADPENGEHEADGQQNESGSGGNPTGSQGDSADSSLGEADPTNNDSRPGQNSAGGSDWQLGEKIGSAGATARDGTTVSVPIYRGKWKGAGLGPNAQYRANGSNTVIVIGEHIARGSITERAKIVHETQHLKDDFRKDAKLDGLLHDEGGKTLSRAEAENRAYQATMEAMRKEYDSLGCSFLDSIIDSECHEVTDNYADQKYKEWFND